jgi:hypothetical protein
MNTAELIAQNIPQSAQLVILEYLGFNLCRGTYVGPLYRELPIYDKLRRIYTDAKIAPKPFEYETGFDELEVDENHLVITLIMCRVFFHREERTTELCLHYYLDRPDAEWCKHTVKYYSRDRYGMRDEIGSLLEA